MTIKIILLNCLAVINVCFCSDNEFEKLNEETVRFNAVGAEISWQSLINPSNPNLPRRAAVYQKNRLFWQHKNCNKLADLYFKNELNASQIRQTYLLCRGPRYTYEEIRQISNLSEQIQTIYNDVQDYVSAAYEHSLENLTAAILELASVRNIKKDQFISKNNNICLKGEKDFEKMMRFSKQEFILKWIWITWRENVKSMKVPYLLMASIENRAAKQNGYKDMGASWRDESELPNVRQLCYKLYEEILPFYKLLHGVVRYQLRQFYGNIVTETGPIPAHLFGDLWSQNWESLTDLILPQTIDFDHRIKALNWTVLHMVKRAEDVYTSFGLPAMTNAFWRESVFKRHNASSRCHGTAADMFRKDDYRILYCADTTFEDFYVLHHEMGHIVYYMSYNKQPGLYRQAYEALHETIGDTIMLGVTTPQHLHRLGLIQDDELYNASTKDNDIDLKMFQNKTANSKRIKKENTHFFEDVQNAYEKINNLAEAKYEIKNSDFIKNMHLENAHKLDDMNNTVKRAITIDDILILKQGLTKIPQIPFALVLDEYRWRLFEGKLDERNLNQEFWSLSRKFQGIVPCEKRGENYFDIGAKYHVADNIPYTRYFLSSFLQYQLFERLCKAAVFGRRNAIQPLPESILLHRCDIYGSKAAGRILKDVMSRGGSQHWRKILNEAADIENINSDSFKAYYRPLYKILERIVSKYKIPIGW